MLMNGSLAVCTHAYSAQVSVLVEQVPGEGGGGLEREERQAVHELYIR